jgi:hypothetical protein
MRHRRQDVSLEGKSTYSTAVLMGKRDEPLIHLVARQAIEQLSQAGGGGSSR